MCNIIEKIIVPCLFFLLLFSGGIQANYSSQGWGRVNMQGTIVDTACAIATGGREQTIDMQIVPVADIIRDGKGRMHPFYIELINCVFSRPNNKLPDWKHFQVTFDGEAEGTSFTLQGDIKGVVLQISDEQGNIATPGTPLPLGNISLGAMRLNYALRLVSNNQALQAGAYSSTVRFKLDYY